MLEAATQPNASNMLSSFTSGFPATKANHAELIYIYKIRRYIYIYIYARVCVCVFPVALVLIMDKVGIYAVTPTLSAIL